MHVCVHVYVYVCACGKSIYMHVRVCVCIYTLNVHVHDAWVDRHTQSKLDNYVEHPPLFGNTYTQSVNSTSTVYNTAWDNCSFH